MHNLMALIKECDDVTRTGSFLFLCQILCHYVSYSYSKTLAYDKKRFLVKLSLICMGKHDFSFRALIWKESKTYDDIKFCKEAKMIIVVYIWSNSLSKKIGDKAYNFFGLKGFMFFISFEILFKVFGDFLWYLEEKSPNLVKI